MDSDAHCLEIFSDIEISKAINLHFQSRNTSSMQKAITESNFIIRFRGKFYEGIIRSMFHGDSNLLILNICKLRCNFLSGICSFVIT